MHGGQTSQHHISRYRHAFYSRMIFMLVVASPAAGDLIFENSLVYEIIN